MDALKWLILIVLGIVAFFICTPIVYSGLYMVLDLCGLVGFGLPIAGILVAAAILYGILK